MEEPIATAKLTADNEVETVPVAMLADYQLITSPEEFSLLLTLAQRFAGKRLVFFNSTAQGGGVALMRHALIPLFKLLDVDAHWYILLPNQDVFDVTKTKFHNVLQAVADKGVELTLRDKRLYNAWIQENADKFASVFQQADVIVIDDPQPSGLIPSIKRINPRAKIIYRSHIQLEAGLADQPQTSQHITWSFLWKYVKEADCYVSHPVREFIPANVPAKKVVLMPATTDPLDGLNKALTEEQMVDYLNYFNRILFDEKQQPLDTNRPYLAQIARFDPSKGLPDVIESYRQVRERLMGEDQPVPQLVLAGNGSIDDPDGHPMHHATLELLRSERYADLAGDVKVARLPHMDQLLNTLLRKCRVALQLSRKEGFEVKVTEALMKGKPVIAYKAGGIPLQIRDGLDGFLVEVGDTGQVAQHLYELLTNNDLYRRMSLAAPGLASKDYRTVPNAICWLFLAVYLLEHGKIEGQYQAVKAWADRSFARRVSLPGEPAL
jgi:glycosyltransferase involved in cell wall biosynthesis